MGELDFKRNDISVTEKQHIVCKEGEERGSFRPRRQTVFRDNTKWTRKQLFNRDGQDRYVSEQARDADDLVESWVLEWHAFWQH